MWVKTATTEAAARRGLGKRSAATAAPLARRHASGSMRHTSRRPANMRARTEGGQPRRKRPPTTSGRQPDVTGSAHHDVRCCRERPSARPARDTRACICEHERPMPCSRRNVLQIARHQRLRDRLLACCGDLLEAHAAAHQRRCVVHPSNLRRAVRRHLAPTHTTVLRYGS